MLHHVGGQRMMIEMRDRRCDDDPNCRKSSNEHRDIGRHGWTTAERDASLAGAWPEGYSDSRYATKAAVSAGFKFFPYAGILPPPCSTWRTSWSLVSRTATASSAGPRLPPLSPIAWQL